MQTSYPIHQYLLPLILIILYLTPLAICLPSSTNTTTPAKYQLKTCVISGDPSKKGLYVSPYHITAGGNDIVLIPNTSFSGFLNGTYQQYDLRTTFPWGMKLVYTQYYTRWLTVEMNVGYGDPGFSLSADQGLISSNAEWRGWLVCDWWHGVPQLFWQYYYETITLPSSCAKVKLVPVYI